MKVLFVVLMIFMTDAYAQKTKRNVEYNKRQKIDLGALMIDGEVITPGDFTISTEKEKAKELLYKRKNYYDRLGINIQYVF